MSEKLTQAQAEKLNLLRGADEGTLPERICQDSTDFSYDILAELCDDGLIKAGKHDAIANRCFHDHEMVQYLDVNQCQSLFEGLCQKLVGVARLGDARGVVVCEYYRCRIEV